MMVVTGRLKYRQSPEMKSTPDAFASEMRAILKGGN